MATGKITKTTVDAIRPGPKDVFLWDDSLPGFGLKVTPAGKRVYLVQYRTGGRGTYPTRYTIGPHGGQWTPSLAREEAKRLLRIVDEGGNPAHEKSERQRIAIDLAFRPYVERFLAVYLRKEWKKAYPLAERILRRHVVPVLKDKPLPSITKADIKALLAGLPDGQVGLRRNTYSLLRLLFNWALDEDDLEKSPMQGVKPPEAPADRERRLDDWELRLAWRASQGLGYPFGPLYRVLTLTGQRREEVAGLDWRELDRATAQWKLPAARAKNGFANTVHLTALVIAELDEIAGGPKWPRRGLVFTTTGTTSVSGYSRAKRRIDAAMLSLLESEAIEAGEDPRELAPWRIHDLRRTMATGMQRLGVRFEVIEACENRVSGLSKSGVAGTYQRHDWEPEKCLAFEAWEVGVRRVIEGLPLKPEKADNVIALAERRA